MEIRINIKQLVFVLIWILILIVALLLTTTRSYMDLLGRAETFGDLLFVFGATLTLIVIGFNFLKNDKDLEKT